ncbi:MAG TPA: hypothetical protein VIM11_01900 [Tepidisphaeraceae bacterium]
MRRRLFFLASLLSLLLFVATVVLWVRSCSVIDGMFFQKWIFRLEGGNVYISYDRLGKRSPSVEFSHESRSRLSDDDGMWFWLNTNLRSPVDFSVAFHLIAPALLLAILPTIYVLLLWRGRRREWVGLCPICAYDLTGNTSGVCPECGTTIKSKAMPIKIA